ncbi:MAG TPA: hypothetical protein VK327_05670, partial [Candidatus Paceibacterota bacterium]|nr:hypothetical protein [Candidatus Paceibacterota bacterium]
MNMSGCSAPLAAIPSKAFRFARFGKFIPVLIVTLFAAFAVVAAETLDDQYFRIYTMVTDADALNASGKTAPALAKYQQAQSELFALKKANPAWNSSVVAFRLNYLKEKIAALSDPGPSV